MRRSLLEPRLPQEEPAWQCLDAGELEAAAFLHADRVLRTTVVAPSSAQLETLGALGFVQVPTFSAQLLDLKRAPTPAELLRAIEPNRRQKVRKACERLERSGGRLEVVAGAEADPAALAAFFEGCLLAGTSARSITPYQPASAHVFQALLAEQDWHLMLLRRGGELLGGAVVRVVPAAMLLQDYCGGPASGRAMHWTRPLVAEELVGDLVFNFASPALTEAEAASVHLALAWRALEWSAGRALGAVSLGADEPLKSGRYLGVIYFKKKLAATTALFWSSTEPTFLRCAARVHLGARTTAVLPRLVGGLPRLRFVCGGSPEDPALRALLASDPHLAKEVVVATSGDARRVEVGCAELRVPAPVSVCVWQPEDDRAP